MLSLSGGTVASVKAWRDNAWTVCAPFISSAGLMGSDVSEVLAELDRAEYLYREMADDGQHPYTESVQPAKGMTNAGPSMVHHETAYGSTVRLSNGMLCF